MILTVSFSSRPVTNTMKHLFYLILFLFPFFVQGQDWSSIGKKINYSETYKKAKKFRNIDKALENPSAVYSLEILADKESGNYQKFYDNCEKFKNLRKLIIDNRWQQLDLKLVPDLSVFSQLEFLQVYDFKNASFAGIEKLDSLKYLAIVGCRLTAFPNEILQLKRLELLDLSINNLSSLPDSINQLSGLKELDLTNNCFTGVPEQISGLKQLIYFDMNNAETADKYFDGTPFCKNSVTEFQGFLKETPSLKEVSFYKLNISAELKAQFRKEYPDVKFGF